ncbi:MAG: substrate-binding domain-containing protein [bacterium]
MKKIIIPAVSALLIILFLGKCSHGTVLRMATTTSVENSGLLDALIPAFKRETGIEIHAVACGTGRALKLAENGDVDLVLTHAPAAEEKFLGRGFGIIRKEIFYNDFIVAGPEDGIQAFKGFKNISQVFSAIAEKKLPFVSRGDNSGTHNREADVWKSAGVGPRGKWYAETGQGMGATLRIADEKKGFCLADRGTFLSYEDKIELVIVFSDSENLKNMYSVIIVNPGRHPHTRYGDAVKFLGWITSKEGKRIIGSVKKKGETLFRPVAL